MAPKRERIGADVACDGDGGWRIKMNWRILLAEAELARRSARKRSDLLPMLAVPNCSPYVEVSFSSFFILVSRLLVVATQLIREYQFS